MIEQAETAAKSGAYRFHPPFRLLSRLGTVDIRDIEIPDNRGWMTPISISRSPGAARPLIVLLGGGIGEAATASQGWAMTRLVSPILEKADLLFVDPAGTGFGQSSSVTRISDVENDAAITAHTIIRWLELAEARPSRIILLGEDYGGRRATNVLNHLYRLPAAMPSRLILMDSCLNPAMDTLAPANPPAYAIAFPTLVAQAWSRHRRGSLGQRVEEARGLALARIVPALMRGSRFPAEERAALRRQMVALVEVEELAARIGVDLKVDLPAPPVTNDAARATVGALLGFDGGYTARNPEIVRRWDWWSGKGRLDFENLDAATDLLTAMARQDDLKVLLLTSAFNTRTPAFASELSLRDLPGDRVAVRSLATDRLNGSRLEPAALSAIGAFVVG